MRRLFTRRNIITGLLSIALIILFLGFYAYKNIRYAVGDTRNVGENLRALHLLESLLDDLQDIETGQRGYTISRDTLFLSPYTAGISNLHEDTTGLRQLANHYPHRYNDYSALLGLVKRRVVYAATSVAAVQQNKYDESVNIIRSDAERILMDSIRAGVFTLEEKDRAILQKSNQQRQAAAGYSIGLIISMLLLSLGGLIWLAWRLLDEEKTRRENEKQIAYLAGLTEQTSDAVFSTDKTGRILSWNHGAEKIFGYTKQEAIGRFAPDITRSGRTPEEITGISASMARYGSISMESVAYNKDGKEIYCLGSVTELRNEKSDVTGYVIIIRDITESKLNQKLLNEFNKELSTQVEEKTTLIKSIVGRIQDGFFSLNNERVFTYVNDYAALVMGAAPADLLGKHLWTIFPDATSSPAFSLVETAFHEQRTLEEEFYYAPYKKWFDATVYPSGTGISVYFKDITGQKNAEEVIRRSNERFDLISRTTNDAIWEWNLETGEMWGNETHQQLYGLKADDPVPSELEWQERLHPDDREAMKQKQEKALASDTNVFITEYRFRTEKNGYRDIYDRCYIVRNDEGKAIRLLGNMMDVTERKKAETQFRDLLESAPDAMIIVNEKGEIVLANHQTEIVFGYKKEELVSRSVETLLPPEASVMHSGHRHSFFKNPEARMMGSGIELSAMRKDGTRFPVEISLSPIETPQGKLVSAAIRDITERREAEEANRTALQLLKYSELVGKTGYWKWDVVTKQVSWSEGTYRIFGEAAEGFQGTLEDFLRRVDKEDKERVMETIRKALETGELTSYEFWIHTPTGERKFIGTTAEPQHDEKGNITLLFGTTIDLTERKTAEEKIQQSEERYRALVENAVEALVVLDVRKGKFVSVSESAAGLFKMTKEELLTRGPADVSPAFQPDGRPSLECAMEKIQLAINGEKPSFEWTHCDKQRNLISCEVRLVKLPSDTGVLIRGSIIDISERKKAERAIIESEETRRLIMNSALDAIVCADMDGQITVWTPQAEKIFGWTEAEAFGKDLAQTIIPERYRDAHRKGMAVYKSTGQGRILSRIIEVNAVNKSGTEFPVELSVIPVKRGDTAFFCAFIRDITDRKMAEARLKDSEEKIRHILSSSADDFYVIDKNFRVTLINATARKNLSLLWNKEVDTGTCILDIFPPDRLEFIRENYQRVFNGESVEYEFTNEIGGKTAWRRVRYSPVKDAEGNITGGFVSTTDISEKKKAEEDIIKTNARFQMVSKATTDIVWDLNLADNLLWWNDNYYANLGYKKQKELVELQEWFENIHPEDLQRVRPKFLEAITGTAATWRDEYRYRKADGSYINILDRGYIMLNKDGKPYRMIGSMVDMTPIYEVQKKVKESEHRLRTILDTDPECIKLMDVNCNLIDINKGGMNMIDADSYEQVLGKSLLTVVAAPQKEKAEAMVRKAFAGQGGLLEFEMITLKGRTRWCEVNIVPFRNPEGEIISVLGVTRDMTERKTAETALARNEEKYRTLVEQAHDAIILFDEEGRLLDVNTGLTLLLGYSKEELLNMHLHDLFTEEEAETDPVRFDVLRKGQSKVKQRKVLRKDGAVVETEIKSQQLPDGRFLSIIRDLSDRIWAERKLEESYQQLRELNGYLENVREEERSHIAREIHDELGQQLTVLKMDISWLKKKLAGADEAVVERLNGLLEMINNTVRSVRRISSELRPSMLDDLGLPAAIEWHAQEFMNRSGITIQTDIDNRDIKLETKTAITLFRVFQESLTNVARHAEAALAKVKLAQEGERLILTVEDNGKGFLPESIKTKRTLGILGMKERIAIIKGSYDIKSSPEKGTIVRVSVPLKES